VSQGRLHTFVSLREDVDFIDIPIIQRDYAQGRESADDVRANFLDALRHALRPAGAPLDLDFVYGSVTRDGMRRLSVLDGQQRLTTLFLLHWYLAAREGRLEDLRSTWWTDGRSRFSYAMRPSAAEFFQGLIREGALPNGEDRRLISTALIDARWFFEAWRRDPTVHSCLVMLDAIHTTFGSEPAGGYAALVEQRRVSFHFLNLPDFGLGDDLYIKMNARGKPLTPFENFKAWLVDRAKEAPWASDFSERLDQRWLDFFWDLAGRSGVVNAAGIGSPDFGDLFLRFFYLQAYFDTCALFGAKRWPDSRDRVWLGTIREARGYVPLRELDIRGVLRAGDLQGVMRVLDFLADPHNVASRETLVRALGPKAGYEEHLQLHAVAAFVRSDAAAGLSEDARRTALHRWLRVTTNLIRNSRIDDPLTAAAMVRGLTELSARAADLYEALAAQAPVQHGFSREQALEESRKAVLILRDPAWEESIEQAEAHWYLQGRVGFLLDFAASTPDLVDQASFLRYRDAFQRVVTSQLLASEEFFLQRALLSLYDYLPESGGNHTFCIPNATTYRDRQENWLRVFQDARFVRLLDAIDDDGVGSLRRLIAASSAKGWRGQVVAWPQLISYCGMRLVRRGGDNELLLLSKSRLRGFFAEAYSLALYWNLTKNRAGGKSVRSATYLYVYGDEWPGVRIRLEKDYVLRYRNGEWQCAGDDGEALAVPEHLVSLVGAV